MMPAEINMHNPNNGWVTPDVLDGPKSRHGLVKHEKIKEATLGHETFDQLARSPRQQHVIPVVQLASNISFVDAKIQPDDHGHNRGRALSTPELSVTKKRSSSQDGISKGTVSASTALSPRKNKHLQREDQGAHEEIKNKHSRRKMKDGIRSMSSPNLNNLLKPSSHPVERLVSVEEHVNETLLAPVSRFLELPSMHQPLSRSPSAQSRSSANLSTSRASTPGIKRESTILVDLENLSTPFGSRNNTPALSSRRNSRKLLDPIMNAPMVVTASKEVEESDRISPPFYASGIPLSFSKPSTPMVEPLRDPGSVSVIPPYADVEPGTNRIQARRRYSLEPISRPQSAILQQQGSSPTHNMSVTSILPQSSNGSRNKLDAESLAQENTTDDQANYLLIDAKPKADILLQLRYSLTPSSPAGNVTPRIVEAEQVALPPSMTPNIRKKKRPGTGLVTPALRAETSVGRNRLAKLPYEKSRKEPRLAPAGQTITNDNKPNYENAKESSPPPSSHKTVFPIGNMSTQINAHDNAFEILPKEPCLSKNNCGAQEQQSSAIGIAKRDDHHVEIKEPKKLLSLEEVEASVLLPVPTFNVDLPVRKANTGSQPERESYVGIVEQSKYTKLLTSGVTETDSKEMPVRKANICRTMTTWEPKNLEESPSVNNKPTSMKLVVPDQDVAVRITVTPSVGNNSEATKTKLGAGDSNVHKRLSSKAVEATKRLYEAPKHMEKLKNTSGRNGGLNNKSQVRLGRTKSKSSLFDRERSISSEKPRVQKPKVKKMGSGMSAKSVPKNKKTKTQNGEKGKAKPDAPKNDIRLLRGIEYEKKTEKALMRFEEHLNSPAIESRGAAKYVNKKEMDHEHTIPNEKSISTPIIADAYPRPEEEDKNLLERFSNNMTCVVHPRRVKSAVSKKNKPKPSSAKSRTGKVAEKDNASSSSSAHLSGKLVRATSAGLIVEKRPVRNGGRKKSSKKASRQALIEEPEIPTDFEPDKHALVSGQNWHILAAKNVVEGMIKSETKHGAECTDITNNSQALPQKAHGLSDKMCPISPRLEMNQRGENLPDEDERPPLSPIQEVATSPYNTLASEKTEESKDQLSPTNNCESGHAIALNDKETIMLEMFDKNNISSNPMPHKNMSPVTSGADVFHSEEDKVESVVILDINHHIEDVTENDECTGGHHDERERMGLASERPLSVASERPLSVAAKTAWQSQDNIDNSGIENSERIQDGLDLPLAVHGVKLSYAFAIREDKQVSSTDHGDDVFLTDGGTFSFSPEYTESVTNAVTGKDDDDDDDMAENVLLEEAGVDDAESEDEEEDIRDKMERELQNLMKSMRSRSNLDALTLINYKKPYDVVVAESNSDDETDNHGTTTFSGNLGFWEEYYDAPVLDGGTLALLFGEPCQEESHPGINSQSAAEREKDKDEENSAEVEDADCDAPTVTMVRRSFSVVSDCSQDTLVGSDEPAKNNNVEVENKSGFSASEDSDEEMLNQLEKTLGADLDSDISDQGDASGSFDPRDLFRASDFNSHSDADDTHPRLTLATLKQHNQIQQQLDKEGQGSFSIYDMNQYKISDRKTMLSRASAFTRTTDSSQVTDSTLKGELDTAACMGWRKGKELGHGSYGTVYEGLTRDGQLIAVKQVAITGERETAEKEYKQVQKEVNLLKTIHHENIVRLLGTCLMGNVVQIFMEHITGGSIASLISQYGALHERIFRNYTKQMLKGIEYLHNLSVVHRDIKGSNVMVMTSGVVKLIDFGCAKRLRESSLKRESRNSDDGKSFESVRGTPYWMAPEVVRSEGHGAKSDIWSMGCTVYEMATSEPPLRHLNRFAAMYHIGNLKEMPNLDPKKCSKSAVSFVDKCLTRDASCRPTAQQLLGHRFIQRRKKLTINDQ